MKQEVKISCIVPTCGREEFLKEALASIFAQTLKPLEIIVVNNGNSPIKLDEKIQKNINIYDIIPKAGASQARNFGACVSSGDFLAFLDDDDLWNENYLKNASEAIKNGALCIISRLDKKNGEEILPFKNASGNMELKKMLIMNPGITGSNIIISKKIFFEDGGFDVRLLTSEDKSLIMETIKKKIPITVLPDNQAIIREHGGERLSDGYKMAEGIRQFTRKYYSYMNLEEYLYNLKKMHWHKFRAGNKSSLAYYGILGIFLKTVKIFNKIIKFTD